MRAMLKWWFWLLAALLLIAAFAAGRISGRLQSAAATDGDRPHTVEAADAQARIWTCSMHPQIRQPGPGQCPICGMDLVPVTDQSSADEHPRRLVVTETARRLMEVQVAPVERRHPVATIRMVGRIAYDETRLKHLTAWVPGRLERLFVDYTGITVREGDHMVQIYSPELLAAQEELLQALRAQGQIERSDIPVMRRTAEWTVDAARQKLKLWGLTAEQVKQIERRGEAVETLTIYAPAGGVVAQKGATEGMYVQAGTRLYTIADLSHVWVLLDAYESDLQWVRYGQRVKITTDALPGETFDGTVSFIAPVVDPRTRTVKVRVDVPNPQLKLKPDMFARAIVESQLALGGRVMEPDLLGKWICPMHPQVVEDEQTGCDICGMDLVRPETLGYVAAGRQQQSAPLVIPVSAALVTGERAIVYVELQSTDRPTYEGREVVLGPRAGEHYIVRSGLEEGELVVTRGSFKIDSALQIQAKQSMMQPEGGVAPAGHAHHGAEVAVAEPPSKVLTPGRFQKQLTQALAAYIEMQGALASDELERVSVAAGDMAAALDRVDMNLLEGEPHMAWMEHLRAMQAALAELSMANHLDAARGAFRLLSASLSRAVEQFGVSEGPVYEMYCPMAFNNEGSHWLQTTRDLRNPYFGAAMLTCGEIRRTLLPTDHAGGGVTE